MYLGPLLHFAVKDSRGWAAEIHDQTQLLVPSACVGILKVHPNWEVVKAPFRIVDLLYFSILRAGH